MRDGAILPGYDALGVEDADAVGDAGEVESAAVCVGGGVVRVLVDAVWYLWEVVYWGL